MIKRILVPIDGSAAAMKGARYAVALAKTHRTTLRGLHVVDVKLLEGPFLRDLSASLGTAPYVNYQGNIALILEERGKAALAEFTRLCEEAGVSSDTIQVTGTIPRAIIEQSDLADLTIMGRGGEHSQWLDGLVGSTTEAVVRRTSSPVLVTGTDTPGFNRFMLAYDGTHMAREALKQAVVIAVNWNIPFDVLTVGHKEDGTILDEARDYLDSHEVDVRYVQQEGDPDETIIRYAEACSVDMIIMGAYGHSKMRELVLGCTTAYVMNHAPCPVLLAR